MTVDDGFDRTISDWLHADAAYRVPDHLDAVLRRTRTERQRPAWSSLERWLPMETVFARRGMSPGSLVWLAVLAALLLAVVGLAIWAGSHQAAPALGLGTNGRILVAVDGAIRSYAADGTDPQDLPTVLQRGSESDLAISPDGTHLAYLPASAAGRIDIVALADGSTRSVALPEGVKAVDPFAWSADSRQLVFAAIGSGQKRIYLAQADGSGVTAVGDGTIPSTLIVSRPILSPDGHWIAFEGMQVGPDAPSLYLIRPDGTGLRSFADLANAFGSGVASWAPDSTTERLLYVDANGAVRIYDATAGGVTYVADGSWPTWSPDASRIAYWDNGTQVVPTPVTTASSATAARPFHGVAGSCHGEATLDGNPVCGPVAWSPDGTKVIGYDSADQALVIADANGTGVPQRIALPDPTEVRIGWQPVRP